MQYHHDINMRCAQSVCSVRVYTCARTCANLKVFGPDPGTKCLGNARSTVFSLGTMFSFSQEIRKVPYLLNTYF